MINGAPEDLPDGASVAEAVPLNGSNALGVAVALNGEVVRRADWSITRVQPGDKIEILRAVGGG